MATTSHTCFTGSGLLPPMAFHKRWLLSNGIAVCMAVLTTAAFGLSVTVDAADPNEPQLRSYKTVKNGITTIVIEDRDVFSYDNPPNANTPADGYNLMATTIQIDPQTAPKAPEKPAIEVNVTIPVGTTNEDGEEVTRMEEPTVEVTEPETPQIRKTSNVPAFLLEPHPEKPNPLLLIPNYDNGVGPEGVPFKKFDYYRAIQRQQGQRYY